MLNKDLKLKVEALGYALNDAETLNDEQIGKLWDCIADDYFIMMMGFYLPTQQKY